MNDHSLSCTCGHERSDHRSQSVDTALGDGVIFYLECLSDDCKCSSFNLSIHTPYYTARKLEQHDED